MANDSVARALSIAALSGGSGEPEAYLKTASVDGNTLTLTNKDDSTVVFSPEGEPELFLKNASVNGSVLTLTKQDDTTVTFTDTDTTYTAGANVAINNNVISATDTTYTAGANVAINNNVISATDTTYTAGANVSINNNVISATDTTYIAGNGINISGNAISAKLKEGESGLVVTGSGLAVNTNNGLQINANDQVTLTDEVISTLNSVATKSTVSVSDTGTATDEVSYITVDGVEKKIAGGGGSSYTFTNGLTESSGTVSWDLNDSIKKDTTTINPPGIIIGDNKNNPTYRGKNASNSGINMSCINKNYIVDNITNASGQGSIIFGDVQATSINGTQIGASGYGSIAGGRASYDYIAAIGNGSVAIGTTSYNSGDLRATAEASQAFGFATQANTKGQFVCGKQNAPDTTNSYVFIIGNGTSNSARSNALTVDWSGNIQCNNIPAPPTADGSYHLACSIASGVATYSWVAQA